MPKELVEACGARNHEWQSWLSAAPLAMPTIMAGVTSASLCYPWSSLHAIGTKGLGTKV